MKKSELKQLIKEVALEEETFNADYDKVFKIYYYEGSDQYAVSLFIGKSVQEAEQEALKKLKAQNSYRKTDKDLWAEIDQPIKWGEVSRKVFKK